MKPFVWETKGERERKVGLVARRVKKGGQCKSPAALGKGDLGSMTESRCPGEAHWKPRGRAGVPEVRPTNRLRSNKIGQKGDEEGKNRC